ncbi:dTMP kinase [Porphyrobacter sp. AAP82]|uniref:dTMP kinase n=1 Tax=Porphyrobacter sp. AAP82 TaxID=1248917 RepID=UPI0002D3D16C|nr:dTMP kinase [Porphyrobacter sp. AAP82]
MTRAPGRFIAFEGGEGAGKSTQARLLAEALRARGLTVVVTREPGGTPGAEAIRALLLAPPGAPWPTQAEALLFAAARADHVAQLIRPALARGEWVICDRFVDSSRAYQGGAGGLGDDAISALHAFGSGGLRPDRVILLDGDEAALAGRLAARGQAADAIEGRPAAYHRAVAAAFRALAEADPQGFARIASAGAPEDVHARIIAALADLLA